MLGEDAALGKLKDDRTKVVALFEHAAKRVLLESHYSFYAPHLLENMILRALIMGRNAQRNYSMLIKPDEIKHLDICIRNPDSKFKYGVRFYGLTERSQQQIEQLLYVFSEERANYRRYSLRERVEAVLVETANMLDCGWEKLSSKMDPDYKLWFIIDEDGIIDSDLES